MLPAIPRQELDSFDGDFGKIGRQIQTSFERAVAFHRWNVGIVCWHTVV